MQKKTNFILVLCFLAGLFLLLYPVVSDYWNSFHQSTAIADYSNVVSNLYDEKAEAVLNAAREYNDSVSKRPHRFIPTEEEHAEYMDTLSIDGKDVMGYLEIPSIHCSLPVYHTVRDSVLQVGVGHIEGSSLPVGGIGTHCLLSGHRGLPSSTLLTHLDKVLEGDLFMLNVLNEQLTYEVDQIRIVEPEDVTDLQLDPEEDYCTLVTCTPYGIKTHRLLVRGHRVENVETAERRKITPDAVQIDPVQVVPFVAAPLVILAVIWLLYGDRHHKE